jgi:hypothetical protein
LQRYINLEIKCTVIRWEIHSTILDKHSEVLKVINNSTINNLPLKQTFRIAFLTYVWLTTFSLKAQENIQKEKKIHLHDSIDIRKYPVDIIDVVNKLRGKDIHSRVYSPDKKLNKAHVSAAPAVGYALANGFAAVVSANLAFYAYDTVNQKISNFSTSITFTQKQQVILPLSINYWTKGNKYNFVSEWRYMKYPSPNFQLSSNSDVSSYTIDFSYLKFHQSILKTIAPNLYAGLGYYFDCFWDIQELELPSQSTTGFQAYGLSHKETSSGLAIKLLYDSRLNQINVCKYRISPQLHIHG